MDLSIVIPAYNEDQKIEHDISEASRFITKSALMAEIIVVDDGSTDALSHVAGNTTVAEGIDKRVIRLERNRGKGFAVRQGVQSSKGRFVMFADTGACTPYEYARKGMDLINQGRCDIAHGSRRLRTSKIHRPQRLMRRIISRLFNIFVKVFMNIPGHFTDTQCGFKIYRGDVAREIYGLCLTERFMFDIEVILLALKRGYRIEEFPIEWKSDYDTRVLPFDTVGSVLNEYWKIKTAVKQGRRGKDK